MNLERILLLTFCLAACSPSRTTGPPSAASVSTPASDTTSTPAIAHLADTNTDGLAPATPEGGVDVSADAAATAQADLAPDAAIAKDTAQTEEAEVAPGSTDEVAVDLDEVASLVAEMTRAPTEELAERLTALGHIGFFTDSEGRVFPTGYPAINADATLIAVAGHPVEQLGASGDRFPVGLTLVRPDGTFSAEILLYDPSETLDASVQASRSKAAQEVLGNHTWRTMKALTPIEWYEGEESLQPAFYADDGSVLLELSRWSITADLKNGPWRATLPEAARVEPGGPFRDEEGVRCEMGRYFSAVNVDPDLRLALLSVVFFPKNDLCWAKITSYVAMRLPVPSGGEGWTQAKRGGAPAWFAKIVELAPEPTPGDELAEEERTELELFVARWGDRFPKHQVVRNAQRALEADRKLRAQP